MEAFPIPAGNIAPAPDPDPWRAAPQETLKAVPAAGAIRRRALATLLRRGAAGAPDPVVLRRRAVIDARRAHAYAALCGFGERCGIPPTFPHLLGFPLHMALLLRPGFPFPVIGLVHLENTIRQHVRLESADALEIEARFAGWLAHDKGQALAIDTRALRAGSLVWESRSVYLRLGARDIRGRPHQPVATPDAPLSTMLRLDLPASLGRRYATVSGDANPIHTSAAAARLFGFPRPIAHGMWSKARAIAALLPNAPVATLTAAIAFKTPAFLPGGACLMAGPPGGTRLIELRDRRETKPHLRGTLAFRAAA